MTALSYATQKSHTKMVELLLSHPDIDVNCKDVHNLQFIHTVLNHFFIGFLVFVL